MHRLPTWWLALSDPWNAAGRGPQHAQVALSARHVTMRSATQDRHDRRASPWPTATDPSSAALRVRRTDRCGLLMADEVVERGVWAFPTACHRRYTTPTSSQVIRLADQQVDLQCSPGSEVTRHQTKGLGE